jgi:hypothetical protein
MLLSSIILTTAFLAVNHLYSTFASPMVSKDGVAVGHSFNLTHSLAKRQYAPEDQKCLQADDWVARTCYTLNGDVEWMDWCLGLFVGVYVVGGVCPFGTMCMDTEIENTDPFNTLPNLIIACVPRPNTIYVIQITIFEIQQNGVVVVGPQTGITDPGHTTVSITLQKRIPGATVSAFLEGTYYLNCPICPADWPHTKALMEITSLHQPTLLSVPWMVQTRRPVITTKQITTAYQRTVTTLTPVPQLPLRLACCLTKMQGSTTRSSALQVN